MNPDYPNERNNQQPAGPPQTPSSPDLYSSLLSQDPATPPPINNKPSLFVRFKQLGFKGYLLAFVLFILVVVALLDLLIKPHKPLAPVKTASSTSASSSKKTTSSSSKKSTSGASSASTITAVNVDYVTVANTSTETAGPVDSGHDFISSNFQPSNYDYAATAYGHYTFIDGSDNSSDGSGQGGNFLYDGKSIYQGTDLVDGSAVLSQNGQHYAYARDNGSNYEIFIDNKLVSSNLDDADTLTMLQVSNDGSSVVYADADSSGSVNLYNNEQLVYQDWGFNAASFSSDLTHYVVSMNDEASNTQLIYDGSVVTGSNLGDGAGVSENGQHFFYLTSPSQSSTTESLFVDNKQVGTVDDQIGIGINDKGDYYYVNPGTHTFYLNNNSYSLSSSDISDSNSSDILISVDQSSSNFIVGNPVTGYWTLNGTIKLTLSGKVFQVQLVGSTLYVYRWAK